MSTKHRVSDHVEMYLNRVNFRKITNRLMSQYALERKRKDCSVCFNSFPNKPWFLCVCSTGLLKTLWEKVKLLDTSNFSFSHSVFYLFGELSAISIKYEIVDSKFFEFGRV